LYVTERLVVSPGAGQFRLHQRWHGSDASPRVEVGDVLGTVGGHEVRSLFAGTLMGLLALEGERVTPSQPVAWLRAVG
ncbi:MAG: hypothetical protein M3R01_05480, partial [Actinomycetota bacterium]|nr:hypothetical protein [Actinomycetota bacterium]